MKDKPGWTAKIINMSGGVTCVHASKMTGLTDGRAKPGWTAKIINMSGGVTSVHASKIAG